MDARWAVKAPWKIIFNIEVTPPDGPAPPGGWASYVEHGIERKPPELDTVLRAHQNLIIHADPGDLLLDKDSDRQNLGVGATFDLLVPVGKTAHVEGLVAYCIDLHRHVPSSGTVFDVLGPAKDEAGAGMQALQRVLEAIACRYSPGFLDYIPGAADAVWRVTEDDHSYVSNPDATLAILAEADVPESTVFNTPHLIDPNAASNATAAVTPSSVLPRKRLAKPTPVRTQKARLASVATVPRSYRQTVGPTVIAVRVTLTGAGAKVVLRVRRSKGRGTLYRRAFRLPVGSTLLGLKLRRLRPGKYQIVAAAPSKPRSAVFEVRRRP